MDCLLEMACDYKSELISNLNWGHIFRSWREIDRT